MSNFDKIPADVQQNIDKLLRENDLNGNGLIERNELEAILKALGIELSDEDITDAILQIDTDGNNVLDMNECREFFALCFLEVQSE